MIKWLLSERDDIYISISATTRKPRANEVDGKDYHFITQEAFDDLTKEGKFLEWARVHGFLYGTLENEVRKNLNEGFNVILEIDPQGASQVREKRSDAVLIFIRPPSLEELENRLKGRGTDSDEEISKRLQDAQSELEQVSKYDYVIINNYVEKAGKELADIIKGETA